jgi:peroxiredoxin Q/BCP
MIQIHKVTKASGIAALAAAVILLFSANLTAADNSDLLEVGEKAPNFKLKNSNGDKMSLKDFRGTPTVVYFYPKDDTPGCTTEACSFRDNYSAYKENNIDVIGISYDSPESHKAFKEKYDLPFTLLADTKKKVAKKYGADRQPNNNVAKRITYLLDADGKVVKVYPDVTPDGHASEILAAYNN